MSFENCSGNRDCAPSESALSGLQCTSNSNASAPAATDARAIGETMAVTMVVGTSIDMEKTVFTPGYTIASILANQFNNADTAGEKEALVYAAFVLLVITTLINGIARLMVMRVARRARRR